MNKRFISPAQNTALKWIIGQTRKTTKAIFRAVKFSGLGHFTLVLLCFSRQYKNIHKLFISDLFWQHTWEPVVFLTKLKSFLKFQSSSKGPSGIQRVVHAAFISSLR